MISSSPGSVLEGQRLGRATQPGEVLGQLEDPPVVQAQALPHGVTALHDGVERTDPGLVGSAEDTADVDDQPVVARVVALLHVSPSEIRWGARAS